jgi:hypothetical protein
MIDAYLGWRVTRADVVVAAFVEEDDARGFAMLKNEFEQAENYFVEHWALNE